MAFTAAFIVVSSLVGTLLGSKTKRAGSLGAGLFAEAGMGGGLVVP